MKYFLRALAIIVSSALLFFWALRGIPIHVYDGFESSHLSRFRWTNRRFEPGAVVSEESVVRAGRRALAITVHSGDRPEAASESGAATERAELMESWWLFSRAGRAYVPSFSLYLPNDFPQTSERLVIAQWKMAGLSIHYPMGRH
jgi:hypothetical protein